MKPRILVATNNPGKLTEIRQILQNRFEIVSLKHENVHGEPQEDGKTFGDNAEQKARYFSKQSGLPTLADDSGLCVDALDGAPGIHSARFAGMPANDKANNAKLLELLKNVPDTQRTAHFVCVMACVLIDGRVIFSEGRCDGLILHKPRGISGFGYDPLFFVPEEQMTFAELPPDRKNAISHRGKALRGLAEKLITLLFS